MPKGWLHDTQVLSWLLSYDGQRQAEPLAITSAGAALAISGVTTLPSSQAFSILCLSNFVLFVAFKTTPDAMTLCACI